MIHTYGHELRCPYKAEALQEQLCLNKANGKVEITRWLPSDQIVERQEEKRCTIHRSFADISTQPVLNDDSVEYIDQSVED